MIRFYLLIPLILLLLLHGSPAAAAEFSGYAEGKGFLYPERTRGHSPSVEGWGTLFNKVEQKLGDAQLTASLRGEWLSTDDQGGVLDPADRHIRRPRCRCRIFGCVCLFRRISTFKWGASSWAGGKRTGTHRLMPFFPVI